MSFWEKILNFIFASGRTPVPYGIYHIACIILLASLTIWFCIKKKDATEKSFNKTIWTVWAVMLVLEIYKQCCFTYTNGGVYQWYAFPFQFCSTPIYLLPLIPLIKNEKVKTSLISFMATFSLFGGLVCYIYPAQIFNPYIGINIQTMTHHGLQIFLAIYLFIWNRKKLSFKWFLSGIIVFAVVSVVAMGLNELIYVTVPGECFNMFYISPHFDCTLPLLSILYPIMPYWCFLTMYFIGFCFVAFIIFIIPYRIEIAKRKKTKLIENKIEAKVKK